MEEDPIKLWQHIHGATAHFPIALIIVSFLFDIGALIFKQPARPGVSEDRDTTVKNPAWRSVAFWTLIIAALGCIPLVISGLAGQIGWFGISGLTEANPESSVLNKFGHRNVALAGSGLAIALAIWRSARRDKFKGAEFAVYLVLLTLATVAIGWAGYLGAYVAKGY